MSKVRLADIPDINAIVELAQELLDKSYYKGIKPDAQKFKMAIAGLIGHKRGIVFVVVDDNDDPQGFMAGVVDEYAFSQSRYGSDLWTYIRDSHRMHAYNMYKRFITWAKSKPKVVMIEFAQSSGIGDHKRWCSLMTKLGMVRVGSLFMMRID